MTGFIRFLIITLPILMAGGMLFLCGWVYRLNQWSRAFDELARRYHGVSMTRWMLPRVMFPYFGGQCTVGTRRRGSKVFGSATFVKLAWPDRRLLLEVHTQPFGSTVSYLSRWQEFQTTDSEFNSTFELRANRTDQAKKMLDESVRWRIREILRLVENQAINIAIERGWMTVSRGGFAKTFQELDDFLRLSMQLADQLKLTQATGIDFVNEDQATVLDDVLCPVCSELVAEEMVVCVRCKTPHCRDCWEYNGHCATFACGETRSFSAIAGGHKSTPNKAK